MTVMRFMAPGPWITRDLKECVLATDYDALQAKVERLCNALEAIVADPGDDLDQYFHDCHSIARNAMLDARAALSK